MHIVTDLNFVYQYDKNNTLISFCKGEDTSLETKSENLDFFNEWHETRWFQGADERLLA